MEALRDRATHDLHKLMEKISVEKRTRARFHYSARMELKSLLISTNGWRDLGIASFRDRLDRHRLSMLDRALPLVDMLRQVQSNA